MSAYHQIQSTTEKHIRLSSFAPYRRVSTASSQQGAVTFDRWNHHHKNHDDVPNSSNLRRISDFSSAVISDDIISSEAIMMNDVLPNPTFSTEGFVKDDKKEVLPIRQIQTRFSNPDIVLHTRNNLEEEHELGYNYKVNVHDVMCGKSSNRNCNSSKFKMNHNNSNHSGNRRLMVLIQMYLIQYKDAMSKHDKSKIIRHIVDIIRQGNGNFIQQRSIDDDCIIWYDIGNIKARDKVRSIFRSLIISHHTKSALIHNAKTKNEHTTTMKKNHGQQKQQRRVSFNIPEVIMTSSITQLNPNQFDHNLHHHDINMNHNCYTNHNDYNHTTNKTTDLIYDDCTANDEQLQRLQCQYNELR